jgi:chemotaxis signal transduction protein
MAGFLDKIAEEQVRQRSLVTEKKNLNYKKFICFYINDREYGIEIEYVREIIEINYIRKVIYTPEFLLGLINLRGSIISVIDLKYFFSLGKFDLQNSDSRLIVVDIDDKTICFAVDKISRIREILPVDVQPSPATFNEIPDKYIIGMYKTSQKNLLVLLNLQEIIDSQQFTELSGEDESE